MNAKRKILTTVIGLMTVLGITAIPAHAAESVSATSEAVPKPKSVGVKGHPSKKAEISTLAVCSPACYDYAGARYVRSAHDIKKMSVNSYVEQPSLDQVDAHTLWEISVEDSTGNIIEIGWNRDRGVNGNVYPALTTNLFVSGWYGPSRTWCGLYNGGCGYQDNPSNSVNAGANIASSIGNYRYWGVEYDATACGSGGWNVIFDGLVIGCFPKDMGHSQNFTNAQTVQVFDEIAAKHDPSCTDMGNSWMANASNTYPSSGQLSYNLNVDWGTGWNLLPWNHSSNNAPNPTFATDSAKWGVALNSSGYILHTGGPGATPNPGGCP